LENPSFILGLNGTGEVQFVFLDKSSGDAESDALAETALKQAVFEGGTLSSFWGEASLVWKSAP
jgi:hypothetical protein